MASFSLGADPIGDDLPVGSDEVLRIRRSTRKTALWAVGAAILTAASVGLLSENLGYKIAGVIGLLLFGAATVMLLVRLVRPRDLLRAGPVGIDQLAVRPHVTVAWAEITDIEVINRDHRVKTVGITVRDPSRLPHRGQVSDVAQSRWFGRVVKVLLGGVQLLAEGPTGASDALDTVRADVDLKATFEISTLGWPVSTERAVDLLRARWIVAGGQPSKPPEHADDE
ncbi:MAG TPA: STM3941 family protein [Solirubrobacteraceae bacterium]|nr:STM3941 family protein [Solirubrobacteraceae bacterium]